MKKMLLVLMLVVLSSLSFAERGDKGGEGGDFYSLYNSAYEASGNPTMHKDLGIENHEIGKVKDIINKGWYEIKLLEVDKLKEVFAIDMLLVEGPGNQKQVERHLEKIKEISEEMDEVYEDMKSDLDEIMDLDKLK